METDNFIMEFDNFYSKEECEKLITMFERHAEAGLVLNRQEGQGASSVTVDDWKYVYPKYNKKYGILNNYDPHGNRYMKIQKTEPAQGYHIWHSENTTKVHTTRLLTWILYLNTIEDGGESEWLYLSKRSKAQEGTLVLWPAGFTHAHRGNPPLKETKYIMTGWVEMH